MGHVTMTTLFLDGLSSEG